jgi:hypothetical protein
MQLDDLLAQAGGLSSIARELGISEQQAQAGAAALLPAILGGFGKQAQSPGAGGLGGLLGQLGGDGLLDDVQSPRPTDIGRGNNVLGQIFGSKDVSRTVAQHAAAQSGLEPSLLRKMLPMLAMLAVGYMARRHGQAANANRQGNGHATTGTGTTPTQGNGGGLGGLGDILGGLLGGKGAGGGLGGILGKLDADGNGNPLDDILRKAGQSPR